MRKFTFFLLLLIAPLCGKEPAALYLTYLHDPTTSITIQWQTDEKTPTTLTYQINKNDPSLPARGMSKKISGNNIFVHTVELLNLKPNTTYHFTLDDSSETHTFRTLPQELTRDVRVVIGGDAYQKKHLFEQMNHIIASLDPDFIILGGDIAYTEGRPKFLTGKNTSIHRWQAFFKMITEQLRAPDGRIIPLIPIIGNHDIPKKNKRIRPIPLLFDFMAFPHTTATFRSIDLGKYCSFLLLDTGHYHNVDGKQKVWLEAALHSREHIPILFPVYHVAAYPSYYRYDSRTPKLIRKTWVPLFEKYPISAAFEHHNHIYKRTHPLLKNEPSPYGLLYLGDGSWGVSPRTPKTPSQAPYLARTASVNAIWLLNLSPSSPATLTSYTNDATPIETFPVPKRQPVPL